MLAQVEFVPPSNGCDLTSMSAFADVTTMSCDQEYVDKDGLRWGVCSSRSAGACTEYAVTGTRLKQLVCECPSPEFVNPEATDDRLAPYLPGGCIPPRLLERVQILSTAVSTLIEKKAGEMDSDGNVTLVIQGDDPARPASWYLANVSATDEELGWLKVQSLGAEIANDARTVQVGYRLTASGIPEGFEA